MHEYPTSAILLYRYAAFAKDVLRDEEAYATALDIVEDMDDSSGAQRGRDLKELMSRKYHAGNVGQSGDVPLVTVQHDAYTSELEPAADDSFGSLPGQVQSTYVLIVCQLQLVMDNQGHRKEGETR